MVIDDLTERMKVILGDLAQIKSAKLEKVNALAFKIETLEEEIAEIEQEIADLDDRVSTMLKDF